VPAPPPGNGNSLYKITNMAASDPVEKENQKQDIFIESTYIRAWVKYGVRSPKFI
jgi:hypothetical protein